MGKEVLPQDKDYILDILDDVFFYIKQGSNSIIIIETKFYQEGITYN